MRPPTASCWTWPLPCLPAAAFGVYHFGMHALLVLIATVAACVLVEYVYEKLMKKPITVSDCSAVVTGMILALNMPPEIPVWIPCSGRHLCHYRGKAAVRRPGTELYEPGSGSQMLPADFLCGKDDEFQLQPGFDGVSGATPLAVLKSGGSRGCAGHVCGTDIPGTIGEVSVIALLIGAAYLSGKEGNHHPDSSAPTY